MAHHDELVARAKFLAGKIIDGEMPPYDAAKIIWNECHYQKMPGDHTFDGFVYWADEYESADDDERKAYCANALRETARHFLKTGSTID